MKLREVMGVLFQKKWSKKNTDDAARGFANVGCDDAPDVELKAFLDIGLDNYQSGHWGIWTYFSYLISEITFALKK